MPFQRELLGWNAPGIEPPQSLKDTGWEAQQKPPAPYFNWTFHLLDQALQELQQDAVHTDDFNNHLNDYNQRMSSQNTQTAILNHGINVISSDRLTQAFNWALQGVTKVNHAPLFDSGLWNFHANVTVNSPSKITLEATGASENSQLDINVSPSTTYTISFGENSNGLLLVRNMDSSVTYVNENLANSKEYSFTTDSSTSQIYVRLSSPSAGTFTFENVMLNEGSTAQEFVANVKPLQNPVLFSRGKNVIDESKYKGMPNISYDGEYFTKTGTSSEGIEINVTSSQEYVLSATGYVPASTADLRVFRVSFYDKEGTYITNYQLDFSGDTVGIRKSIAFTTPSNAKEAKAYALAQNGDVIYKNVQLELGDTATEFTPYTPSYQTIQGSLYEGDQLTWDENGNPVKLASTRELALDSSLDWSFKQDYAGYKRVGTPVTNSVNDTDLAIKSDGKILNTGSTWGDSEDGSRVITDVINITIADADSGWTDAMTGTEITADYIRAYFNGWAYTNDYNADGTTGDIGWISMYDAADKTTDVAVAVSRNLHEENGKDGYRLIYQLADKETVPVTSEGVTELHEGENQIEVAKNYDTETDSLGLPYESADVPQSEITFAKNIGTQVNENVRKLTDNSRKIDILSSEKADKNQEQWIEPTLLNGWVNMGSGYERAAYYKDQFGNVHIKGAVRDGSNGTDIFILPKEYRPKEHINRPSSINGGSANIRVYSDGRVYVFDGVGTNWTSIGISPFRAEQ